MVAHGMYEADINVLATRMVDSWEDACDYYGVKSSDYPLTVAHKKCVRIPYPAGCLPLTLAAPSSRLASAVIAVA